MLLVSIGTGFVAAHPLPALGAPVGISVFVGSLLFAPLGRRFALCEGLFLVLGKVHLRRGDNRGVNHLATLGHVFGRIELPLYVSKYCNGAARLGELVFEVLDAAGIG